VEIVRELLAPTAASTLFAYVDDLAAYETWMPMIHDVVRLADGPNANPAWSVELRAEVGPFARSKRLRMERTTHERDRLAVFERMEDDGRDHSAWILRAELTALDEEAPLTTLTMSMTYGGSLWGGAILQRVLDDQIRQGSDALLDLVS
jgi:hypothetical protein